MTRQFQLWRVLRILSVVIRHALAWLIALPDSSTSEPSRFRRWLAGQFELTRMTGPKRFRRLFEDLGGSFIKFGQMLALQPDIVSLEYCDELFNLLDRIAPFPVEHVERVFVEEFGRTTSELFDEFDREPLATASIGQVHTAVLRGRKVAVKVQRPNVDTDFQGDIRLMTMTIAGIRKLQLTSLYWMIEPMGEFAAWTREELDYRREARYADRLRRNAEANEFERVPEVFWELTTRRTLVLEFLSGMIVLDYMRALAAGDDWTPHKLRSQGFDPNRFARHIIDNFLGDAFQYGVFHADLHPANLLILPGDCVGYVDFGITGVLSRYSRRHLVAMTLAYTRADVNGMADSFFKLTFSSPDADPARFRAILAEMSQDWYEGEGSQTVFKKNFTLVMLDMLTLSRKTGIWPERDVIKYIRSAIATDGLITRFAPGFNVGRYLEEVCQRWVVWEARRATLRYDTFAGFAASSAHLAQDGATRAASVLRRLVDGETLARVDITTVGRGDGRLRRRTLRLAGLVVAFTALFELTGAPPQVGVNLFTAEAVLMGGALLALGDSVRRLASAG
jgi:predicted unusual protein kinase regulating ubiquinone biosynthesis (AarF/ABC1/UbiB family)